MVLNYLRIYYFFKDFVDLLNLNFVYYLMSEQNHQKKDYLILLEDFIMEKILVDVQD
jgi:hypothetical protein